MRWLWMGWIWLWLFASVLHILSIFILYILLCSECTVLALFVCCNRDVSNFAGCFPTFLEYETMQWNKKQALLGKLYLYIVSLLWKQFKFNHKITKNAFLSHMNVHFQRNWGQQIVDRTHDSGFVIIYYLFFIICRI